MPGQLSVLLAQQTEALTYDALSKSRDIFIAAVLQDA